MTLQEKFEKVNILDYRFKERDLDSETLYVDSEKCEKIADEFAIGFAEWIFTNGRETIRKANEDGLKSTKELLEIYKKTL